MLIKIAILDCEIQAGSRMEAWLIDILKARKVRNHIELFQTKEGLCTELKRQHFDLIFLEVGTRETNGIEISQYLREYLNNYITRIVYISENDVLASQLCKFMPIDYLIKPVKKEQIVTLMEKYFSIDAQGREVFQYRKQMDDYTVPYAEIMYIECNAHKLIIYTKDYKDEFYGTMENVYNELQHKDFLFLHKSYIVNYHFIKDYHYTEVEMEEGRMLSVSRLRRKEIYARYMQIKNRNT